MDEKLFNDKLLVVETLFGAKITPYKKIDGKEVGPLKSGGELILEYQKLLTIAGEASINGKITDAQFVKVKEYLKEIYNKYITNNSKLLEENTKRR